MQKQSIAVQYFLPFTIAMIMLAMGLGLVVEDFRRIFDKPRVVLVGLAAVGPETMFAPARPMLGSVR